MVTADQIPPDSKFYNGGVWLKDIPGMIKKGHLKSARKIKEEDKQLETDDLEDYQTQMLKSATKLKPKEEIKNVDGSISQVTPVTFPQTKTCMVALGSKTTKVTATDPTECITCKNYQKNTKHALLIFCKSCLKIRTLKPIILNALINPSQMNLGAIQ